jgi:hypothetical protein
MSCREQGKVGLFYSTVMFEATDSCEGELLFRRTNTKLRLGTSKSQVGVQEELVKRPVNHLADVNDIR